jgi:hypothetical protein
MICKICQKEFIPNKYHSNQQVCPQPECQKMRQIQNIREWRKKNPDYFKSLGQEAAWQEKRRRYNRLWKSLNKGNLKVYEQINKEQRREYMREYMKRYRILRSDVNRDKI